MAGVFMTNLHVRNPEMNHEALQEVLAPFNAMTEISIFLLFGLLVNPMDLTPNLVLGVGAALLLMLVAAAAGDEIKLVLRQNVYSVIHFNFGLHDMKYLDEKGTYVTPDKGKQVALLPEYEANLRKIVARLKHQDVRTRVRPRRLVDDLPVLDQGCHRRPP